MLVYQRVATKHGYSISMAMQQEPIDWRYLPYIRPKNKAYVKGIFAENMALYGTNVPSEIPIEHITTVWW